jgi:hypothetical protein
MPPIVLYEQLRNRKTKRAVDLGAIAQKSRKKEGGGSPPKKVIKDRMRAVH